MHMHTHTCGWTCSCMCLCESICFHLLHTSVCMYVYMLYLCIHMYKCTYICMLLNMYVWLNMCVYVCVYICVCQYTCTHTLEYSVCVGLCVYAYIYIHVSLSGTATCYKDQVCIKQWRVPAAAASTESSGKSNPEWWHLRKQTLVEWGNILWFKKQVAITSVSKYVLGPYLALRCHTGNWGYQGEDDPVLSLEELTSW